ncbi:hypothetical protein BRD05_08390 [Halobacteriales archaeon QS_9_70_65]|nr:MAG: hypothetical protein BRD05_08390 [Halobacteriales archaeon QS_9_70_65]
MRTNRRGFLRATGSACLIGAVGNADAAPDTNTTRGRWSQFCRNSRNTGYAPEVDAPTSNVGTRWEFRTEGSVESSPVVANGVVFVGSDDGRLDALDATDGSKQWSFDTGSEIHSAPAVDDGTVFVIAQDTSVYALDAANGAEQWSVQFSDTGTTRVSSVTVSDGVLYVGVSGSGTYALDGTDGSRRWGRESVQARPLPTPTVADGIVYVGTGDYELRGLDADGGDEVWSFETGANAESAPAVDDGTAYFGSLDRKVYGVDTATGTEQWSFETDYWVTASPAVTASTVYAGSRDGSVYALRRDVGTERWSFDTDAERRNRRRTLGAAFGTGHRVFARGGRRLGLRRNYRRVRLRTVRGARVRRSESRVVVGVDGSRSRRATRRDRIHDQAIPRRRHPARWMIVYDSIRTDEGAAPDGPMG